MTGQDTPAKPQPLNNCFASQVNIVYEFIAIVGVNSVYFLYFFLVFSRHQKIIHSYVLSLIRKFNWLSIVILVCYLVIVILNVYQYDVPYKLLV